MGYYNYINHSGNIGAILSKRTMRCIVVIARL